MPKFTVVKQRVFIIEAESDSEANNIVVKGLEAGAQYDSQDAFFAADYTKIFSYGEGEAVTSLTLEYEPEKSEVRRVTGYVDTSGDTVEP